MSSRTSFARCSNFLLSPFSKTFRVTVPRLAASGYRAVVGHAKDGLMGPRNLSSARLVLRILVWVAMSKRRRTWRTVPDSSDCRLEGQVDPSTNWSGVRVYVVCKLFKTLLEGFAVRRGRSLCLLCSPLWYRQWERRTWMVRGAETCQVMVSTDC